jgi:hypothetical protein
MRYSLQFLIIIFFINISSAQSPCNDEAIMSVKGSWKKRSDALMNAGNQAQVISHIDAISNLFKTAYPEPKGIEAGWYRTMGGNPVINNNGPIPYQFNSLYFAWYCNTNVNKLLLGGETGTWAYAFVNSFSWFISNQYDLLIIKVNGENVYILPPIKGEWKGYPVYQASSHGDKGRCIILTYNNQVPWKPITQEQYLNALRKFWEKQKQASDDSYIKQEEGLKKGITETQNNKYLKQADKDKIIAGLQKDFDDLPKRKAISIAKSDKYWNDRFSIIDKYINQNVSSLQLPVIIDNQVVNDFKGNFSTLEKGGQMLITVDPNYFNKQLPRYAAQMIVLYWRWDNNAPGLNFKKEFEENFPVDKLKAMLDK